MQQTNDWERTIVGFEACLFVRDVWATPWGLLGGNCLRLKILNSIWCL